MLLLLVTAPAGIFLWAWVGINLLVKKVEIIRGVKSSFGDGPGELRRVVDGELEFLLGFYLDGDFFYEVPRPAYQHVLGLIMLLVAITMFCGGVACLIQ
jgi:hypothetical protein